jgi:putative two-component system response regulator
MPEMDGYQVCELLKSDERLSDVPVIFLTALNTLDDKLRGFRCGGADYVSKPFQIEEVQARVQTHIQLRRLQRAIETDNNRLQTLVSAQVKKIADAQMETIFAIARLAEARDDETGRHLERIQTFCGLLATGMSERPRHRDVIDSVWIQNLVHASPLHDIGKVAIPDRILMKPGRLSPDEYEIMKTHAALGAGTLRKVHERYPDNQFIGMGIRIAQHHHEWWNGAGYPDGLAGETIPLCARILSVADCYDAIRSKRCYKPAMPHEDACAIICRESGTHFDPHIVAVFGECRDAYRQAWDRLGDGGNSGSGG